MYSAQIRSSRTSLQKQIPSSNRGRAEPRPEAAQRNRRGSTDNNFEITFDSTSPFLPPAAAVQMWLHGRFAKRNFSSSHRNFLAVLQA